jgi:hypothetical protein
MLEEAQLVTLFSCKGVWVVPTKGGTDLSRYSLETVAEFSKTTG